LHLSIGIGLSNHAVATFVTSMVIFDIFLFSFFNKLEHDEEIYQNKIAQEVEKRQNQEALLLRQKRMANMGEMIDAIAHQWRQPLNQSNMLILDIEDTLKDESHLSDHVKNQLSKLTNVTTHMSQTIDDFRKLLHHNKEEQYFSIDESIQEVFSLMQNNLRDVKIEYHKISDDTILGYKNELIQVFIILFSNALDVFRDNKIKDKKLSIMVQKYAKSISIHIEDNAGGVDDAVIQKVFDPYFTTKKQSGGTGLGLYVAKIMVEQNMKGRLTLANTQKYATKGAKFTIQINIREDKNDQKNLSSA